MEHGGRRDPSEYVTIKAEVFYDRSPSKNGVRPINGEIFPQSMKIECSREIRNYPVGTIIEIAVVETDKGGGIPFLYSSYKWSHSIISKP